MCVLVFHRAACLFGGRSRGGRSEILKTKMNKLKMSS